VNDAFAFNGFVDNSYVDNNTWTVHTQYLDECYCNMTIDAIAINILSASRSFDNCIQRHELIPSHSNQTKPTTPTKMQSTQNMSVASTISGNALNPIIISDDDHSEVTYAQTPFFSGFGSIHSDSSDASSTSNSGTASFTSPHLASTTTMQHPHNMSPGTTTIRGRAYNPIIISDDENEDDYDVRLFVSVFADTEEASSPLTQESMEVRMVHELVREIMGCI
jgi:hypothetical protein